MLAIIITFFGSLFGEVGVSIGKREVSLKEESRYTMGFLNLFWGALVFLFIAIFIRGSFNFSLASLPTFGLRVFLEIIQVHVTLLAVTRADRSAFGFIRVLTIPLLFAADFLLGYSISSSQTIGIGIIIVSLLILFLNHGFKKHGAWFALFSALNAVLTISLFKYDITNFNSVEAEQSFMLLILLAYLFLMARFSAGENPFLFFKKRIFIAQSLAEGLGGVIMSFAYVFAPASIIVAAERSLEVFWSVLSGNVYFHEKHLAIKVGGFAFATLGLFLLAT